jgi:hypothetical protein
MTRSNKGALRAPLLFCCRHGFFSSRRNH